MATLDATQKILQKIQSDIAEIKTDIRGIQTHLNSIEEYLAGAVANATQARGIAERLKVRVKRLEDRK